MADTASLEEASLGAGRETRCVVGGTKSVPAVENAFLILEVLAGSRTGVTIRELSKLCGLPRSSVHCILVTLQRHDYLYRSQFTGRYFFGRRLALLANHAPGNLELCEQADLHMRALAQSTGLTTQLGIVEFHEAVILATVDRSGIWSLESPFLGKRIELHCSGLGKALIAQWPQLELERVFKERKLSRHNDNTISCFRKLNDELARVRRLGYAIDDEEDELGRRCVGVPVCDRTGKTVAAIGVSGTIEEITAHNVSSIVAKAQAAALALSRCLASAADTVGAARQRPSPRETLIK